MPLPRCWRQKAEQQLKRRWRSRNALCPRTIFEGERSLQPRRQDKGGKEARRRSLTSLEDVDFDVELVLHEGKEDAFVGVDFFDRQAGYLCPCEHIAIRHQRVAQCQAREARLTSTIGEVAVLKVF